MKTFHFLLYTVPGNQKAHWCFQLYIVKDFYDVLYAWNNDNNNPFSLFCQTEEFGVV